MEGGEDVDDANMFTFSPRTYEEEGAASTSVIDVRLNNGNDGKW